MRRLMRPARRRALIGVALSIVVAIAAIGTGAVAPAAAGTQPSAQPGTRITVAMFGDSVTESILIPNYLTEGLAPQVSRDLVPFGYVQGGAGLMPAAPYRWHYNKWVSYDTGPTPKTGWTTIGDGLRAGFDGPSGYSAVATSPLATATATVTDPDLQVLFTSTGAPCVFTVNVAGQTYPIETYRPGLNYDVAYPIVVPPGRHLMTIHGPNCGLLEFDGVIAQEPVPPGKVQVEVDNLGHAAKLPWVDFQPRVQQLLKTEQYNVSVFLYGYLADLFVKGRLPPEYVDAMVARAKIARMHGGVCLVVAPTPLDASASQVTQTAVLDRLVAKRGGCRYTTVLSHLWGTPASAEHQGLLLIDGVHPTAKGYTLIAKALAPVIAGLVKAQLQHLPSS
jgi:lysophospholipase L1-like esterase